MENSHAHNHWNPGLVGGPPRNNNGGTPPELWHQHLQQQNDPTSAPSSSCLLVGGGGGVGVGVQQNDPSSLFGYPLVLPPPPDNGGGGGGGGGREQFRRFTPSASNIHFASLPNSVLSVHPSGPGNHNGGGGGGGGGGHLEMGIPQHSLALPLELGGHEEHEQGANNVGGQVQDQGHHNGLDECSECSDDDDDDDEDDSDEDDMQMERTGYVQTSLHMGRNSLSVEEEPLPSCQQQQQQHHPHQLRVICTTNGNVLMEDTSIEESIPPINQGHPLNSNPISAIPMITGGSCDPHPMNMNGMGMVGNGAVGVGVDPSCGGVGNNGQSVHGKMYAEERVVFHLKQWSDSGFGNFNSCREQEEQLKNTLYPCAVCHLRSPHNGLQQKDTTHRHPVRGLLFSFDDCIILELYPEDYIEDGGNGQDSLNPKHSLALNVHGDKVNEPVTMSYFNAPSSSSTMPMSMEKEGVAVSVLAQQDQHQQQGWWEYESSGREIEEHQRNTTIPHPQPQQHSTDAINLKLNAQNYHDSQMHETLEDSQQQKCQEDLQIQEEDNCDDFTKYDSPVCYSVTKLLSQSSNSNSNLMKLSENEVHVNSPIDSQGPEDEDDDILPQPEPLIEEGSSYQDHQNNKVPAKKKPTTLQQKSKPKVKKNISKYACPSCNKLFNIKRLLKQHLDETHPEGNPFKCSQCKMQYADTKLLQRHSCTLSVDSIKQRLKIKETNLFEQNQEDKELSIAEEGKKNTFAFNPTEIGEIIIPKSSKVRKFSEKASLKAHLLSQQSDTPSNNSVEDSSTSMPSSTEDNQTETNKVKRLTKNDIEDSENGQIQPRFLPTSKSSSNTSPIKENQDQNLNKGLDLNLNLSEFDGISLEERKNSKPFRCTSCGKCFAIETKLRRHLATCSDQNQNRIDERGKGRQKGSACEICGKRFQRRDKLLRHMYVHSEEKMFSCEICEKRFSRRDKLRDHLKSHQTDEIHNCPSCEKQFLRPDILKQHIKMHQMGDKHQCPECLRFVTGKERLAHHIKRHEEAKALGQTLVCPLCTKYFIQRQSLKAHIRKFHPDALTQLNLIEDIEDDSRDREDQEGNGTTDNNNINNPHPQSPSSSHSKSPSTSFAEPIVDEHSHPRVSTVCKVLKTVMSSNKIKLKKKAKDKTTPKDKNQSQDQTLEEETKKPLPFSCTLCPESFSRKQFLKNHEIFKHSESSGKKTCHTSSPPIDETFKTNIKASKKKPVSRTQDIKEEKRNVKNDDKGKHKSSSQSSKSKSKIGKEKTTSSSDTSNKYSKRTLKKTEHPATVTLLPSSSTSTTAATIPSINTGTTSVNDQLLKLPSCSSLVTSSSSSSDLSLSSFVLPQHSVYQLPHPQSQPHPITTAYSHHLALSMVGGRGGLNLNLQNLQNIHHHLQPPGLGLMSTSTTTVPPNSSSLDSNGQFMQSPVGVLSHSQSTDGLLCHPSTSYVINYQGTLPYHE